MLSFDRFRCVYHAAESKLSSSRFCSRVFCSIEFFDPAIFALCGSIRIVSVQNNDIR